MRSIPTSSGPFFDAFVFYEGSIYWTETTIQADGTGTTALWAVMVAAGSVGQPRLVVPDMGFAQLSGSAHDVVVADGRISWAAVAGAQQPGTLVRSVAVAADGGDSVRLELVAPDGSGRTRIAGPATFLRRG